MGKKGGSEVAEVGMLSRPLTVGNISSFFMKRNVEVHTENKGRKKRRGKEVQKEEMMEE